MPVYEYRCPVCDVTYAERRPMAASGDPASCPEGHPGGRRLLSVFASVGSSAASAPAAAAAPGGGGCCGGACGCG